MVELGLAHGRFQIFHLRHLEYVLAAKMRCKKLFIGIEQADDVQPFTYYERFQMIHDALLDFGVKREEFEIVPFPIEKAERILQYAPKDAVYYMNISNGWGEEKLEILTLLGLKTEVLWRKTAEEAGVTGVQIQELIRAEDDWRQLVPKSVYEYIVDHGLDRRIRGLSE